MNVPFGVGSIIDNSALTDVFKCAPQGGMRRSHATNSLVLVSNHVEKTYDDRQDGDIFLYTGMGMSGDQNLEFAQNKTLNKSRTNGVRLYFFEVFKSGNYIYRGEVQLVKEPFNAVQIGEDGRSRSVWVFPLKLLENEAGELNLEIIDEFEDVQKKKARKLDLDELKQRAGQAGAESSSRIVKTKSYIRNQYISEYTRRSAKGICQLCKSHAPFADKSGEPFLESHHIEWLSNGGPDSIENTVALCPNCHKRMHVLNDPNDIELLKHSKSA